MSVDQNKAHILEMIRTFVYNIMLTEYLLLKTSAVKYHHILSVELKLLQLGLQVGNVSEIGSNDAVTI